MVKKLLNNKNFNNSFWSVLDVLIYPIFFLATTPFFIKNLGADLFGIWLLMTTLNVSLQALNFGIGSALVYYTAKYTTSKQYEKLSNIFNSIFNLFIFLIPILFLFGYLISLIFANTDFFNIPIEYKSLAVKSVLITSLIACFKIFQTTLMSILNGKEIYNVNTIVNTLSRIVVILLAVVLVIFKQGIFEILVVSLIVNILATIVYFMSIQIHFDHYTFKLFISKESLTEVFSYGFWVWLQSIFSTISFQLDKFFVTAISGPSLLVYYSLSSTLVNQMHMVFGALSSWLFPRISSLIEKSKNFVSIYTSVRSLVMTFAYISILVLIFIKQPLLILWLGEENTLIMLPLFNLFLIYEIIYVQTIIPVFLMQGMKKIKLATAYIFVYKGLIILGMTYAYFKTKDVESLISFMTIPLFLVLPVLHYIIDRRTIKQNVFYESGLIFLPTFLLSTLVIVSIMKFQLIIVVLLLITIYFVYYKKIDFEKLK